MTESRDGYFKLKYIGFTRAYMNPDNDPVTVEEFVAFCKTYLCNKNKVLFKDPIWDTYTDEELMVEYFAQMFLDDVEEAKKFSANFAETADDTYKWLTEQTEKAEKENLEKIKELPDSISFKPGTGA